MLELHKFSAKVNFQKQDFFVFRRFDTTFLIDLSGFFHSTQSLIVPKKHVWENGYADRFKRSHI